MSDVVRDIVPADMADHGGRRKGSGRKRLGEHAKLHPKTIRMTLEARARFESLVEKRDATPGEVFEQMLDATEKEEA